MKQLSNVFFVFLILLILYSCSPQSEKDQKLLDERISRIENGLQPNLQIKYGDSVSIQYYNIEERMKELGIPGVSIAVMNNGVIEWAKGYGMADSSENREVTTETLFQAGSISKPIAATRILQLAEKRKINLDSNVNDYLTSWKLPDNKFTEKEKVTTRRMLNHSAGLTTWGFPGYAKGDTLPSIAEILDGKGNTGSVRVYKEPGQDWQYSGGGYTIMQLMITDIEQKQFPEIMQEHVLDPFGMTSSTYTNPLPKKYHDLAATGYYNDQTAVKGKWHTYPEMAAAGLWTTPSQLVLWTKEIQQILQTQKDGLLKVETVNEMLIPEDGEDQGLGPYVLKHTFGHGGADEGFRADLMAWKEAPISVAMMSNSDNGSSIFREIFLSIAQEYDLPGIEPRTRAFNKQSSKELARFIGKYHFPKNGDATIKIKDSGLEFTGEIFSGPIFLLPENENTFFNKNTGTYYKFQFEGDTITSVKFSRFEAKKIE
jgi:CubicO group peptidase (beta-lactamase class C family)